jgi:hypothetical protein
MATTVYEREISSGAPVNFGGKFNWELQQLVIAPSL